MVYYYKTAFSFSSSTTSVNKHSKKGKILFGQGDKSKNIWNIILGRATYYT